MLSHMIPKLIVQAEYLHIHKDYNKRKYINSFAFIQDTILCHIRERN